MAILGLFCVLTGCGFTFREATETFPYQETTAPQETALPMESESDSPEETVKAEETQEVHVPETEVSMPALPIENTENIPSEEAMEWITLYEQKGDPHALLLNEEEIALLNERIRESCPTMPQMDLIPDSISSAQVAEWINAGTTPRYSAKDANGNPIGWDQIEAIEGNKNLSALGDSVIPKTAIVTKRTNLRTVPTHVNFFTEGDTNRHFDRIQETELILGSPVLILHESLDGAFLYVQAYHYRGWINATDAAEAETEDYRRFLPENLTNGVTVIADVTVTDSGEKLDMGTAFPYLSHDDESFTVELPCRGEDGKLFFRPAAIQKSDAYYGKLPYTVENFITQAFKFLGTEYSWGGYNEGVDCSGFVCAVFRSFGIYLPRNTGEQKLYGGTVTSFEGLQKNEVIASLKELNAPAAIHRPGHVMLYLGTKDDIIYVIHAPSGGLSVCVVGLSQTDNLTAAAEVK